MLLLRKRHAIVAFLLVAVLMFSACTAVAPSAPADTTAPAAPAEEAADSPAAEAGPTALRVTFSWPTFIDPAVGNDFSSSASLINLYDTLIFPNADGGVDPWLAESWQVSDDGTTYTFKLREGVTFHDGSELTASDVVYSFDRLTSIVEGFAYMLADAESATAIDENTVEFKLAAPSGLFLPSLLRLYVLNEDLVKANTAAEGPYGEHGDFGKDWLLVNDAGSGPYTVKEFPLEEFLLMEKNQDWWGEFAPNAPDQVRFIGTTEGVTIRTLMANQELEITDQWQTVQALQALDEIEGVDIAAIPTMNEFYYMINTKLAPTDDVHCRRAMAYAFDYDTAVSLEWPGTQQSKSPVPVSVGGHNPDVFVFSRDLDKAKEELAQCQYADDLANNPVELHWVSEVPDEEKFALLFQSNMAEIGIDVKVVSVPWLSTVDNTSAQETSPHIVTIYVTADLPEAGTMLYQRYHYQHRQPVAAERMVARRRV
ncbi:MAG: ABC transporter substrate-binding protein [Chloroflexota bacterium]|nr:ABC transporter substrate-binding protein [Chloroflexota bacterium]